MPCPFVNVLTRLEFQRRYSAMPKVRKAELIEGVVYIASPVRFRSHAEPHANIIGWLGFYSIYTSGTEVANNATVRLDSGNEVQPDGLLRLRDSKQSRISENDLLEGAPELIVEIAASSASIDAHDKLKVYRRNQVQEYLIWRVLDGEFDWFRLKEGKYIQLEPNAAGIICSEVFPGLWLDKSALLSGNLNQVLAVLQQGLASAEHENFVKQLSN
ncbi:MAG TPA: Uma2 family endonuclease [Nostocaceae cyanobacterium]|nr:Uma2 family endonuclease [Nostocaceae cyanobacterium]